MRQFQRQALAADNDDQALAMETWTDEALDAAISKASDPRFVDHTPTVITGIHAYAIRRQRRESK